MILPKQCFSDLFFHRNPRALCTFKRLPEKKAFFSACPEWLHNAVNFQKFEYMMTRIFYGFSQI